MSNKEIGGGWTEKTLDELRRIQASLRRWYTVPQTEGWCRLPHKAFDGRSAISLIQSGRADEVWAEIDRLASSAHV